MVLLCFLRWNGLRGMKIEGRVVVSGVRFGWEEVERIVLLVVISELAINGKVRVLVAVRLIVYPR